MDIYSNHRVPFNTGVWLRTHKFSPTAVRVTRALQAIAKLDEQQAALDKARSRAEVELDAVLIEAHQKLMDSPNGY